MPTVTCNAKVNLDIVAHQILSAGLLAGAIPAKFQELLNLTSGTTDGAIDLAYAVQVTGKAASATTSYDLVGGVADAFGSTQSFAEVCLVAIKNRRTTALAYLSVGPHATNGFGKLASSRGFFGATADVTNGGGITIAPDSWYVAYQKDGVPCVAATSDVLAIVTSGVAGSTNEWDLLILGRSA